MKLKALTVESVAKTGRPPSSYAIFALQEMIDKYENTRQKHFRLNAALDRKLVSFQDNKSAPIYRLFKYKESFSADLVNYLIDRLDMGVGPILDPFSGTGTTGIVSASRSIPSIGIELLPVGNLIATARREIMNGLPNRTVKNLRRWKDEKEWRQCSRPEELTTMPITRGAYPKDTEYHIRQFLTSCKKEAEPVQTLLLFALCSILESVSYTRKDGQCLRWDYRSGRKAGNRPFNKGRIYGFDEAIDEKLENILSDANTLGAPNLFDSDTTQIGDSVFLQGTVLREMPLLKKNQFSAIITSPPYCNRYDYTRTYALELAALGISGKNLVDMRQDLLSCTVENRAKDLLSINGDWTGTINCAREHKILAPILDYLWKQKSAGKLNNNGIPRMIEGYFIEMACVIYECQRVLRPGGKMAMINDNVRYAGIPIPVDLVLSDIAIHCGFSVDNIMVLPTGKGNSSQQMGEHGRTPLRKCVYVWRKS